MDNFSLGYSNSMYMAYGLNQALAGGHSALMADGLAAPADGPTDAYMGTVETGDASSAPVAEGDSGDTSGGMAVTAALGIGLATVAAGILAAEGADGGGDGGCDAE